MTWRRIENPGLQIKVSTTIKDTNQVGGLCKNQVINQVPDQVLSQIINRARDQDRNLTRGHHIPGQIQNLLQDQVADRQILGQVALDRVADHQILDQVLGHQQAENLLHDLAK